jgi:hypothetical protein
VITGATGPTGPDGGGVAVVVVVVVFVVLVAAAVTPVPVNCTWCRPDPSSPVICHVAVAGPAVVGVKATVSVIVSPG